MSNTPQLEFTLKAEVQIGTPLDFGITDAGHRRIIPILGGTFKGPNLTGKVLAGGADWQILRPDGGADLEARYTLEATDGTLIYVLNRGMRRGDPETLKALNRGENIDPAKIYFRTVATFETSAPEHAWLGRAFFVGSGERYPDRVVVNFWKVL